MEAGWYIHPKGENSMVVSGCKSLSRDNYFSYFKCKWPYLLHAVFKSNLLARAGEHCLSNLITNVLSATGAILCPARGRKTSTYRVRLQAEHTQYS